MGKLLLKGKDLRKLGYTEDKVISRAIQVMHGYYKHTSKSEALELLQQVLNAPETYIENEMLGRFAGLMIKTEEIIQPQIEIKKEHTAFHIYGDPNIEQGAIHQMQVAMKLPISVAGALMPDAHQGYGLPIGGVLATRNAVIPFGVGVDIGCRMSLSIFNTEASFINGQGKRLERILDEQTLFGSGKEFSKPMDDEVLERREFYEVPMLRNLQSKAAKQIGSSGSGNHFVEFGEVKLDAANDFNLPAGGYFGLLSHSGSRALGASIARYYTDIAMEQCRLPNVARHMAWLDLDTQEGQEYWMAMNLAGDYAAACHHQIHHKIAKQLGLRAAHVIENHHNFAWKELWNGKEVIVHRKGATPAAEGVYGIIPGSMTANGYIVKGKGQVSAINSAAHGAGRKMSRSQAKESISHSSMKELLKKHKVTLIGGGIDEAPQAYKNIDEVMQYQQQLVEIMGVFTPKIVKMDG